MHDEPCGPATGIVLDPQQPLQQTPVLQSVVVARQCGPAAADRPFCRQIDLLQRVAGEAVAEVNHFADVGLITQHHVAAFHPVLVDAVLQAQIGKPVFVDLSAHRCEQIGTLRIAQFGRERDFLLLEVVALAERESQLLVTGIRIDQAAGNRGGELVRVIDPVAAGKLVLGKYLREIEIR